MAPPHLLRLIPSLLLLFFFLTSCAEDESFSPQGGNPDLGGRLISGLPQIAGVSGIWNSSLGDCAPPIANCVDAGSYYRTGSPSSLDQAITQNTLNAFLVTNDGKNFLDGLDISVKGDLETGRTTIKEFNGRYFFVFPGASNPYDGPNYGKGGRTILAAEIP